jgi:hypothetical protein
MNAQKRNDIASDIFTECLNILQSKGLDYSSEDVLSSFKNVANTIGISPEQVAMMFIETKLERLRNLENKDPKHESVRDSILDCINYLSLYYCILLEKQ